MADKQDGDRSEPTLELPSLFRRKRREEPEPKAEARTTPEPAPQAQAEPKAKPAPVAVHEPEERPARQRPRLAALPTLPAAVSAALTGLLVGAVGTLLTWGGLAGCEAVRGTSSCGGGPGLLLLLVILGVMVVVGALLLGLLGVPEPRGASFLGVGVLAVVAMVLLMESLFSAWMFLVVPVVTAAAYALAHWVTTRHVDAPEDARGIDLH